MRWHSQSLETRGGSLCRLMEQDLSPVYINIYKSIYLQVYRSIYTILYVYNSTKNSYLGLNGRSLITAISDFCDFYILICDSERQEYKTVWLLLSDFRIFLYGLNICDFTWINIAVLETVLKNMSYMRVYWSVAEYL